MASDVLVVIAWPLAILLTVAGTVGWLAYLGRGEWVELERLSERFVYGVPWGSLVVIVGLLGTYLIVQDGFSHWDRPVYLPFVNWSYLYPTGVALGAFTHANPGHLASNLTAAVVLAPLAEYIWGHYPPRQGRDRPWQRPWVRALVVFPVVVGSVGLLTSLFAWGPVIGFSGVIFAFAGFTVIRYPLATVVVLAARAVIREVGRAITSPVVVTEATREVSHPWWVGVSVQGHLFGFLVGALVGILLIHHRDTRPASAVRLWLGVTLVTVGMGLWAIWHGLGDDAYVMYRALGLVLLLGIALLLTTAAVATSRPLWGTLTRRQTAILAVMVPLLVLAVVAVPFNILTVADHDPPTASMTVGDYDIYYTEGTERQLIPVVPLPAFTDTPRGTASGLVVTSADRHMWFVAVSQNDLGTDGDADVALGGIGWRSDVHVARTGWTPLGNDTVYRIELTGEEGTATAFASEPRAANVTIAGQRIALVAEIEGFSVRVTAMDGSTATHLIPPDGESITVGDLTIRRSGDHLLAERDGTSVPVAIQETSH